MRLSSPSILRGAAGVGLLLLTGCLTAPSYPLPDPLPEVLEWSTGQAAFGRFLGLEVRENDSGSLEDLFFAPGVKVTRVVDNSPAEKADFQVGDVVLKIGAHDVNDPGALESLVNQSPVDEDVTLRVSRGDSVFDVKVRLVSKGGTESESERVWVSDPSR
ncbi:MAG: PDZ domain-containing protein, partial [Planctomycetota bacterium]|nr:PDZ domain-containing protein [Planctomycetota bacterium]